MTESTERIRLVPPEEEGATLAAIDVEVKHLMRELSVGQHAVYATCPEGLRETFLLRAAAARRCFGVHPASLAKLLKILESEEAYTPPED
jgi:hypothetical protein